MSGDAKAWDRGRAETGPLEIALSALETANAIASSPAVQDAIYKARLAAGEALEAARLEAST